MKLLEPVLAYSVSTVPRPDLLAMIRTLWEHFEATELPPSNHGRHVDVVASAWLASAYRHAKAAAVLIEENLIDAAVANARVAFENAIYLSLISDARDVDTVLDGLELRFLGIWNSVIATSPAMRPLESLLVEAADDLKAARKVRDWVKDVSQVCHRLHSGDVVYAHYRMLSSEMHPGFGSAVPYMVDSFRSGLLGKEPADITGNLALEIAVGACVWAGWATDELFGIEAFGPVVSTPASRLNYTPLRRIAD